MRTDQPAPGIWAHAAIAIARDLHVLARAPHGHFLRTMRIIDPDYRAGEVAPLQRDYQRPTNTGAGHVPPLRNPDPARRDLFGEMLPQEG